MAELVSDFEETVSNFFCRLCRLCRNQSIFPFMWQYAMGLYFYRMKLVKPKDLCCVREKKRVIPARDL